MAELDIVNNGNVLYVDSRLVAERLGIQHETFLETIENHRTQVEQAFGVFRFETGKPPRGSKGGRPFRFALLTEDQATFLMTLSRNTPEVVQCKIDSESTLIRDYFPAIVLQRYIAMCEVTANLMLARQCDPLEAVQQAAQLALPHGLFPTPIDFAEHIRDAQPRLMP